MAGEETRGGGLDPYLKRLSSLTLGSRVAWAGLGRGRGRKQRKEGRKWGGGRVV